MSRLQAQVGTLRQLEIILAVHEHQSVTLAARALFLTQPTVSMQLRKLADALGEPLYNQVGRRLVFTPAGEALVRTAREVHDSFSRLEMKLADLRGLKAGRLRLAVVTTSKYLIPHFLGDFTRQYPAIEIDLYIGNRDQIMQRMSQALDDFYVFSHPLGGGDLEIKRFAPNPLVPVVAQDNPLVNAGLVSFERFCEEPMLIREPGSGTRFAIDEHFGRLGLTLNVRMTVASNEAIKQCVMSGLGVAILSRHSLLHGGAEGLAEIQVEHLPIECDWYIAHLRARTLSVVGRTFLDYLDSQVEYCG